MVDAGQKRLSAAKMIFWKWALGIGVGAACAGGVVAIERSRALPPLVVVSPRVVDVVPPIEATGTATVGGTPLTTASLDLPIVEVPPPATALPPPKPPRNAISKVFRVREPVATGVAHFDSCLPNCETRDPQVVGQEQAAVAAPAPVVAALPAPRAEPVPPGVPVPPALIPEPQVSVMPPPLEGAAEPVPLPSDRNVVDIAVDGGRHVIHRVEGASNAVVDGTRRALDAAVDLVW